MTLPTALDATARADKRIGYYVMTFSGRRWWPHDPHSDDVFVGDLAGLAQVNRFGGSTSYQWPDWRKGLLAPYTVAQHSCLVYDLVCAWTWERCPGFDQLPAGHPIRAVITMERTCALLHDGHEVYPPGDQLSPTLRYDCAETQAIRALSRRAADAFRTALGLPLVMPDIVKQADAVMLATEKRDLMPPELTGDDNGRILPTPRPRRIEVWDPEHARAAFFRRLSDVAPHLFNLPASTDKSRLEPEAIDEHSSDLEIVRRALGLALEFIDAADLDVDAEEGAVLDFIARVYDASKSGDMTGIRREIAEAE